MVFSAFLQCALDRRRVCLSNFANLPYCSDFVAAVRKGREEVCCGITVLDLVGVVKRGVGCFRYDGGLVNSSASVIVTDLKTDCIQIHSCYAF